MTGPLSGVLTGPLTGVVTGPLPPAAGAMRLAERLGSGHGALGVTHLAAVATLLVGHEVVGVSAAAAVQERHAAVRDGNVAVTDQLLTTAPAGVSRPLLTDRLRLELLQLTGSVAVGPHTGGARPAVRGTRPRGRRTELRPRPTEGRQRRDGLPAATERLAEVHSRALSAVYDTDCHQ